MSVECSENICYLEKGVLSPFVRVSVKKKGRKKGQEKLLAS